MEYKSRNNISSYLKIYGIILLMAFGFVDLSNAQIQTEKEIQLPEFIAHRGASYLAPENTLASIQLAWAMDVDAVEIDVYLTGDNEIVLLHDNTTTRTSGQEFEVEKENLDRLKELEVGSWKGAQWEGEKIITLDEALATVPEGKRIIVETKSGPDIVEPMLDAFDRSGLHPHQIVVIAFSYEVASKTKERRPQQTVLYLKSFRQNDETGEWIPSMEELIAQTKEANLDGVNMSFRGPATMQEEVDKIREAGLGYYVWTVNNIQDAELAVELGVDGLTTDRPVWVKKQLLSRNGWKLLKKP